MHEPKQVAYMTVEEHLAREETSSVRHEYVDGRIFAMTGGMPRHNMIAGNIYSAVRAHLRGSGCRVYMSDVKARVKPANSFYYPDVMVSCDELDDDAVYASGAVLIVEVLSRTTARIDKREKVIAYKQIETLREYLIVHQKRKLAELHRKNSLGFWEVLEFGPGTELSLEAVPGGPLRISISAIDEDIDLPDDENWSIQEGEADDYDLDSEESF